MCTQRKIVFMASGYLRSELVTYVRLIPLGSGYGSPISSSETAKENEPRTDERRCPHVIGCWTAGTESVLALT